MRISRKQGQAFRRYEWPTSYVGSSGVFLGAVGLAFLISGDVLPGLFFILAGASGAAYAYRDQQRRMRNPTRQ